MVSIALALFCVCLTFIFAVCTVVVLACCLCRKEGQRADLAQQFAQVQVPLCTLAWVQSLQDFLPGESGEDEGISSVKV